MTAAPRDESYAADVDDLVKSFGRQPALQGFSLRLRKGEFSSPFRGGLGWGSGSVPRHLHWRPRRAMICAEARVAAAAPTAFVPVAPGAL